MEILLFSRILPKWLFLIWVQFRFEYQQREKFLSSLKKYVMDSQCFNGFSFVVPIVIHSLSLLLTVYLFDVTWVWTCNKGFSFTLSKLFFYSTWNISSYLLIKIIAEPTVGPSNANISQSQFYMKIGDCIILLMHYSLTKQEI